MRLSITLESAWILFSIVALTFATIELLEAKKDKRALGAAVKNGRRLIADYNILSAALNMSAQAVFLLIGILVLILTEHTNVEPYRVLVRMVAVLAQIFIVAQLVAQRRLRARLMRGARH